MKRNRNKRRPRKTPKELKTHKELPPELLGIIFEYYVETETDFRSLETLQLVCRLWNKLIIGHQALWGILHIHLGHKPTHDAWRVILPRRLERAGNSTPLSIEIIFELKDAEFDCHEPVSPPEWNDWVEYGDIYGIHRDCLCFRKATEC